MAYENKQSPQKVEEPDLAGHYTAADYLTWKFEGLVELVRGKIFKMSPAPAKKHQRILRLLVAAIDRKLQRPCELWLSPFDVYFCKPGEDYHLAENIFQPDLCIVCDPGKVKEMGIIGAPDFVLEILSPCTRQKDLTLKLEVYEEYGVPEYWIVSVDEKIVIINRLDENGHYQALPAKTEGAIVSPLNFPEVKVDLDEVFSGLVE